MLPALNLAPATLDYKVNSSGGLTLFVSGVPVVKGSGFQYYAPGWTKGYFSSTNAQAHVEKPSSDTLVASFHSADGLTVASETFHLEGQKLHVRYAFDWNGTSPAKVELNAGLLWGSVIGGGSLKANGQPTRSLLPKPYVTQSWDERRYGPDAKLYEFSEPFGDFSVSSTIPLTLLDGRSGFEQDWARGRELLWLGSEDLNVEKGTETTVNVDWIVSGNDGSGTVAPGVVHLESKEIPDAYHADESIPPLIPNPQSAELDYDHPVAVTGAWGFPAGRFSFFGEFEAALKRRFVLPVAKPTTPVLNIDGGVSKLGLTEGAYRITIRPGDVSVVGEKEAGLRYGLQRIAQLAFIKNGQVMLPTGELNDEPVTTWRGVHLFGGPHAVEFQKKLWERVLLPLGFNKVVVQCERTDWKSVPGIQTAETMSREDLAKLFDMYRSMNVEPIPLIESYGHDEWLFANGKNLDLAIDPKAPYAVDPRKPETKKLFENLWDEVADLLHPTTFHFGLDEVDMESFPKDPDVKDDLWKTQMSTLADIAQTHGAKIMLWGDQLLAPGEAPDATNADSGKDSALRRATIPKGSMIADWHYLADSHPARYTSLGLFKREEFVPIASAWYSPENIRGFYLAAVSGGFGTLQTTWAGYTSDEKAVYDNYNQFTAMVLAADYSWSGRQTELKDLPYSAADVFRRMYFGTPQSPQPLAGHGFSLGQAMGKQVGTSRFQLGQPIALRSNVLSSSTLEPLESTVTLSGTGKTLALALDTVIHGEDGDEVGVIEVQLANGSTVDRPLVYGHQVRSRDDVGSCMFADRTDGISAITIDLGATPVGVKALKIKESNPFIGLRLLGVTLY